MIYQQQFHCTLLSDVVLSSKGATEGFVPSLDYIPGARFLGLIASKLYEESNAAQTLDIFHNGTVKFGDATVLLDGEPSLHVPLMWHTDKEGDITQRAAIYLNRGDGEAQRKQVRTGYFTEPGSIFMPRQRFYLKSAYDSESRRAKEGQMFGYYVLPRGSKWQFGISSSKQDYLIEIAAMLCDGPKRIGRSRSASFGLLRIEAAAAQTTLAPISFRAGANLIYAKSNLCFVNGAGQFTLTPDTALLEGIGFPKDSTLMPEQTHIRSRIYQSWNRYRSNRDEDRQIVEHGSVLAIFCPSAGNILPFIGSFQAEGFGEILINPAFLTEERLQRLQPLRRIENVNTVESHYATGEMDEALLALLRARKSTTKSTEKINSEANNFIKLNKAKFNNVKASQWGVLRNAAQTSTSNEILHIRLFGTNKDGFLFKGKSAPQWAKGREMLQAYLFPDTKRVNARALLMKTASLMAKEASKTTDYADV